MNNLQLNLLVDFVSTKKILILGLGREGKSTFFFLRKYFPHKRIVLADQNLNLRFQKPWNEVVDVDWILGDDYLKSIENAELVFKSPGISLKDIEIPTKIDISSQTDLFLKLFGNQTIGVTGTKGKSTTASLLFHLLQKMNLQTFLVGNIGLPALEMEAQITNQSWIVYEMSSHQLEFVNHSPHWSVLLNLHQEHLDHYRSYLHYRNAKWNIASHQLQTDFLVACGDESQVLEDMENQRITSQVMKYGFDTSNDLYWQPDGNLYFQKIWIGKFDFEEIKLKGLHNYSNILNALLLAKVKFGLDFKSAFELLKDFNPLAHRMEYVGEIAGRKFYNDSISTIPESCIRALQSIPNTSVLILGGMDRGINYDSLIRFLLNYKPLTILLLGEVGRKLLLELSSQQYLGMLLPVPNFEAAIPLCLEYCNEGEVCLLSPAASSYDQFKNFEDRGNQFKQQIENHSDFLPK